MKFLNTNVDFSYIILAIYAFFGHSQAIQALMLCFLFRHLNISLNINSSIILPWLVFISSIISIFLHLKLPVIKKNFYQTSLFFLFTLFLIFFLVIHGIFFSQYTLISMIKALLWSSLSISLLVAFYSLSLQETLELQKNFFWFFLMLIIISFSFHFMPNIGYSHDGRGFQGIFNHPQVFGLIVSLFSSIVVIFILSQKYFSLRTFSSFALLIFCLILIYLSASRTALFSLLLSLITFFFFSIFFKKKFFFNTYNIIFNKNFRIFIIIIILTLICFFNYYNQHILNFIDKDYNTKNIMDAYFEARSVAIDPVIDNIKSKWLMGIGFGLPSLSDFTILNEINYEIFNFSKYEKGNLFFLVLEELGFLGLLIFILWLFLLIRESILSGDNIRLIIILNIIFANLSEAVLFSSGGFGLFFIILLYYSSVRSNF
jgi:O-antigen ligase